VRAPAGGYWGDEPYGRTVPVSGPATPWPKSIRIVHSLTVTGGVNTRLALALAALNGMQPLRR
jgi:hypothetical protein